MTQPIQLIINPTSGYGSAGASRRELSRMMSDSGWSVHEHITKGPGDATHIARAAVGSARAVIAFGGDGTVREVADGLVGSQTPMLVAPAGTENLMAKLLGIDNDPQRLLAMIDSGRTAPMDLARVNGRSFHTILGVGFDAEVVRRVTQGRSGNITHMSYLGPIWRTLGSYRHPQLNITADGDRIFNGQGLAFVSNTKQYGGGLGICPVACSDDGLLDLVVLPCENRKQLYAWAWRVARGRLLEHPDAIHRTFRVARIETTPNETCEIDGDIGPGGPLKISLHDKPILLLVPENYQPSQSGGLGEADVV